MRYLISAALLAMTILAGGQIAPDKYFVKFTDKNNSPYSLDNPSAFLSQRSIDRRVKQGIGYNQTDLPVNPQYVEGVAGTGAAVLNRTKWLNGVTIYTADSSVIDAINNLPYVASVSGPVKTSFQGEAVADKPFFSHENYFQAVPQMLKNGNTTSAYDYGEAYNQIHMLKGDQLHEMGYRGQGMVIAVLDAGFYNADTLPAFDSLWDNNQILGTHDFVDGGEVSFDEHAHGSMVLSCMGGNQPGQMIGTAPKASYWLLRSEDGGSEYIIEEYNWVSAAEFADSAGADVINSSLGYSEFNDPLQNHTYADMDGNTTPVTIGADFAAQKGILVVNSLGNEGTDDWYYLIAPSDGDSVFGIGAVDADGYYASFSSHGPSADGRVKPNVVAQGSGVYVLDPYSGQYTYSGGTSFSSPITAGMVACLWQANPEFTNMQIIDAVQQSASQYLNPDDMLGYGIPDYIMANNILTVVDEGTPASSNLIIYPNPFYESIFVFASVAVNQQGRVEVTDLTGKTVYSDSFTLNGHPFRIDLPVSLTAGIYIIRIESSGNIEVGKMIKK